MIMYKTSTFKLHIVESTKSEYARNENEHTWPTAQNQEGMSTTQTGRQPIRARV